MIRECFEETRLVHKSWSHFCTMTGPDFRVDCFAGVTPDLNKAEGTNAEPAVRVDVSLIQSGKRGLVDGLQWLIPMAIDHLGDGQPASSGVMYSQWPVVKDGKTGGCEAAKTGSK